MSKIPIGVINGTAAGYRDAVHVAIVSTVSDFTLVSGQRIRFTDDSLKLAVPTESVNTEAMDYKLLAHAVVDPFINYEVKPGQVFFAFLMPGTTPKLSHHFNVSLAAMEEGINDQLHKEWCNGYGC